jgi:ABC-type amino acid transport substrate-binding protein
MPRTTLSFYLHIIAVAVVVFAVGNWLSSRTPDRAEGSPSIISGDSSAAPRNDNRESVFDRVMRTKTIRCGYFIRAGFLMKDVNTGAFSGIAHDYVEELAKSLSLTVDWAEEIGSGDIATALQTGRVDAQCSVIWPTSARARAMDFVAPVALTPLVAVVRADETRFNGDYAQLNATQFSGAFVDGSTMGMVTQRNFANAKPHSLPQLSALTEPLVDVAGGKADFALSDSFLAHNFMAKNPGKLKILSPNSLGVYTNALFIKQDEYKFKRMLDVATQELIQTGVIDRIIKKYDIYPGTILPIAHFTE